MSVRLMVHVQPKASENRVVGYDDAGRLKVRVTASPTDGKANDAIVEAISRSLGIPRRHVEIERGHTSRTKIVRIKGVSQDDVRRILGGNDARSP